MWAGSRETTFFLTSWVLCCLECFLRLFACNFAFSVHCRAALLHNRAKPWGVLSGRACWAFSILICMPCCRFHFEKGLPMPAFPATFRGGVCEARAARRSAGLARAAMRRGRKDLVVPGARRAGCRSACRLSSFVPRKQETHHSDANTVFNLRQSPHLSTKALLRDSFVCCYFNEDGLL